MRTFCSYAVNRWNTCRNIKAWCVWLKPTIQILTSLSFKREDSLPHADNCGGGQAGSETLTDSFSAEIPDEEEDLELHAPGWIGLFKWSFCSKSTAFLVFVYVYLGMHIAGTACQSRVWGLNFQTTAVCCTWCLALHSITWDNLLREIQADM